MEHRKVAVLTAFFLNVTMPTPHDNFTNRQECAASSCHHVDKKIKKEKKHKYTGYKLRFPKLAELTPLEPFVFCCSFFTHEKNT